MTVHRRLAALFLILSLAGCVQVATEQGQVPDAPYTQDNDGYRHDRGGDGGGGGM